MEKKQVDLFVEELNNLFEKYHFEIKSHEDVDIREINKEGEPVSIATGHFNKKEKKFKINMYWE